MSLYFTILMLRFLFVNSSQIEPKVVWGNQTTIQHHPFSAFIIISQETSAHICGSSIINQRVILTAAHCFDDLNEHTKGTANVGHTNKRKGRSMRISIIRVHPNYDTVKITCDIALAGLAKDITFDAVINRVALSQQRPHKRIALLAGWGLVSEDPLKDTDVLHETEQLILSRKKCIKLLKNIPPGTFCGGRGRDGGYPSVGDSGSPLVVNGYLQVGLVSFKKMHITTSVIVYTDVPYYYDWIVENAEKIPARRTANISRGTGRQDIPTACGSSLVMDRAVVTAAHCLDELKYHNGHITAFLGATVPIHAKLVRRVLDYRTHPKYVAKNGIYNLGVAFFNDRVPLDRFVKKIPIALHTPSSGTILSTSGWGKQVPKKLPDYSDQRHLKASKQKLIDDRECEHYSKFRMSSAYLCTVSMNGYHYHGDSGNGLVTKDHFLVAVVSYMINDATIYSNVVLERRWIKESILSIIKHC